MHPNLSLLASAPVTIDSETMYVWSSADVLITWLKNLLKLFQICLLSFTLLFFCHVYSFFSWKATTVKIVISNVGYVDKKNVHTNGLVECRPVLITLPPLIWNDLTSQQSGAQPCLHSTYTLSEGRVQEVKGALVSALCLRNKLAFVQKTGWKLKVKLLQPAELTLVSPCLLLLSSYILFRDFIEGISVFYFLSPTPRMFSWFASHSSAPPPSRMSVPRWGRPAACYYCCTSNVLMLFSFTSQSWCLRMTVYICSGAGLGQTLFRFPFFHSVTKHILC